MASVEQLLNEFRAAFEAGDEPAIRDFLDRAGDAGARQELEAAIDRYLMEAPRAPWDPVAYQDSPAREAVERVFESIEGESGSWPVLLPRLRARARIKRSEVVWRLSEALAVDDRERVADYLNRMEHGRLPAAGVSNQVIEALAKILGAAAETIRAAGTGSETGKATVFARTAEPDPELSPPAPASAPSAVPDAGDTEKVDRLFTGGP